MLRWLGLRSRLVLLVLIALVPVFGLLAYSSAQNRKAAIMLAESNLQSEVLLAAVHQQRLVEMVSHQLDGIASDIKNLNPGLCGLYLRNLHAQRPQFSNLGVAGLDGKLICNARQVSGDVDAGDWTFFKQLMAGQRFAVGQYGGESSSQQAGIGFAVPVHGNEGAINAVAFAALGLPALDSALTSVSVLPGARLAVLDRNGVVLAAQPAQPALLGSRHPDLVVQKALQGRQEGLRHAPDTEGLQQIYAFAPVPGGDGGGLFVAISMPYERIAAQSRDVLGFELLVLLAVTLLGITGAWWMGDRLIVNPAQAILKGANEVANGNLAARVDVGRRYQGELSQIGRSFNRMASALQARRNELDAALRHVGKERSLLDLMLNSMSEGVIAADTGGHFLLFNAAAHRLFPLPMPGASLDSWYQNHEALMLDGKTVIGRQDRPLSQAIRGVSLDNWDLLIRAPGINDRVLRMNTRPLRDAGKQLIGGVAVFIDITERKAAEAFARAQEQVLALIAEGAPLLQSLEAIVRLIENRAPGSLCAIMLVEGAQLRHGVAPSLPESCNQQMDGLRIGDGVGASGTAAYLKQPVVVDNVGSDPLMQDFKELLLSHGLQACWAIPVLSGEGEVLAIFAIYHRTPCKPQAKDLEMMDSATRLARIALERARAEAALTSSEARFRELAENIQDVFYNRDARSDHMLYVSPGYEKIWGRSCESLYANPKSYLDAIFPEDLPVRLQANERNHAGESSDVEYRIRLSDGQTRWIRDHSYPVFKATGELERVVGTARDITDRKLADLELARTNRALQMLSRSSVVINRRDDEMDLLADVCRVAVEVGNYRMAWVGYAQDDEQRSIKPMAHAGEEAGYLSMIKLSWLDSHGAGQGPAGQTIRRGQPYQSSDITDATHHFYWREAALQRGYRSAICLPLRNEQRTFGVLCLYASEAQRFSDDEIRLLQELADNLAFGIGSIRSQLERRRVEEAARKADAKVREQASLLDKAHEAILVCDLEHRVQFWNQGAERLYGWSAAEMLGQSVWVRLSHEAPGFYRAMALLLERGEWVGELSQRAKNGSLLSVEGHWTLVRDEQGQPSAVLAINTDIRERKRAQQEIMRLNASLEERVKQRTAQLEFANKELEAFSYSVSHDLRTPLSAIDGFSDLLEKALAAPANPKTSERSQHFIRRIRVGVAHMGELIDALLSLSQLSRTRLRWEPVNLSALVLAVFDGYQERHPERAARLDLEPGLMAHGDPRLLKQVFDNLLGNAWKFSAGQPQTQIAFGCETGDDGEKVYFVRDNGAGFDMAYAKKLFGAFQRLHSPSEFAGTGIGLATVHRIVERHGGHIWAQSAPQQGATFYFTLGTVKP
ncbi:PAS domain S-box protein [Polaromonas sp.]|uniref:PAS domain S-box protein n=1 Tax=Polaromonas sp. TaxID=1869339 RepID=UPI002FCB87C2